MYNVPEKLKNALERYELSDIKSFSVDNTQKLFKIDFKGQVNNFVIVYYDDKYALLRDVQGLQAYLEHNLKKDNQLLDTKIKHTYQDQIDNSDDYARKNEEVVIKEREAIIYDYEIITPLTLVNNHYEIDIRLHTSSGFYVRSFANDLGKLLNTYASLKELRRIKSGALSVGNSYTLEAILNNNYKIIEIENFFNFRKINISERTYKFASNGVTLYPKNFKEIINEKYISLFYEDKLVAIYEKINDIFRPIFIKK